MELRLSRSANVRCVNADTGVLGSGEVNLSKATWTLTLLFAAAATLVLNLSGLLFGPSLAGGAPITTGLSVPGYHYAVRDKDRLQAMLDQPMPRFDLELVNNEVFESLVHSDNRRIQLHENWLMWVAGLFYEPMSRTQNPERIVSGGQAICSEAAAVVNEIARVNNLDARLIALSGHVVAEVLTEEGWQIADPDYGVVYSVGLQALEARTMTADITQKLSRKGFNKVTIAQYIEFFGTSEDNVVLDVGAASSPRLYAFENLSELLKWMIPGILFLLTLVMLRRQMRNAG